MRVTHQDFQNIGIRVLSATKPQQAVSENTSPLILPELTINTLSSVHIRPAVEEDAGAPSPSTEIALPAAKGIALDSLLNALQQVESRFSLETALTLHEETASWFEHIRPELPAKASGHYEVLLTGGFGEITLNTEKLQPARLHDFFATALNALSSFQLYSQYQLLQEGDSIQARLKASSSQETELEQQIQVLVLKADQLASELELAPTPNAPEVLSLLREFIHILQQLDEDMTVLQQGVDQGQQQAKKIETVFSEQLQQRLRKVRESLARCKSPLDASWQLFEVLSKQKSLS